MKNLLFFIIIFFNITLFAQRKQQILDINWENNYIVKDLDKEFLYFEGAQYQDNSVIPTILYQEKVNSPALYKVEIKVIEKTLVYINNSNLLSQIPDDINVTQSISSQRYDNWLNVSFNPVYRAQNNVYLVKKVSLSYVPEKSIKREKSINYYAENSLMRSGRWIKIRLQNTGMYKITHSKLNELGFSNSTMVSLFGIGGAVPSYINGDYRIDDMKQIPVLHQNGAMYFYAEGNTVWKYDTINGEGMFVHEKHDFSDYIYYFLSDVESPVNMAQAESFSNYDTEVSEYTGYAVHENDSLNLITSGRTWYGEHFDIETSYSFPFAFSDIVAGEECKIYSNTLARSSSNSSFLVRNNGTTIKSISQTAVNTTHYTSQYAKESTEIYGFIPSSGNMNISFTYNKPDASSQGWLDFVSLNVRQKLIYKNSPLFFRDERSILSNRKTKFNISGADANIIIWDVTDINNIKNIPYSLSGNIASFIVETSELREFIVFKPGDCSSVSVVGEVANQNLHGQVVPDMAIVCHPDFLTQAELLAEHHRNFDDMIVHIVTPQQIYNEFSSGTPAVTAVRDYAKMHFDKSTETNNFKYLLLFGDGSFNNKSQSEDNSNYVLTYQSANSLAPTSSYVSDDFFGLLSVGEGTVAGDEMLDIGVGRLPVQTQDEAQSVVDKIINYAVSTESMGGWRNSICFIGDDAEDVTNHQEQAKALANMAQTKYPYFNIDRIFLDAYPQVSTPAGYRYPDVNKAINDRMKSGALFMNYTGHGNEVGLAHEHVLGVSEIMSWQNYDRLPVFVTATCEFSRFDNPERTSAGELILLNPEGGGVGLLTTTRLVYSQPNFALNQAFYEVLLDENTDYDYRLGDLIMYAKNKIATGTNKRNFTLLGDPALRPAFPKEYIYITHINETPVDSQVDTLKALTEVKISGYIGDDGQDILSDFSGIVYPLVYDKPITVTSLSNDGNTPVVFEQQKNILFKGKASVENGYFDFSFIVPRDINYNIGNGKFSLYAIDFSTKKDAKGYFDEVLIGGSSNEGVNDDEGPEIELFMNDENFAFGGMTDEDPLLIAKVEDSSGINTVGNGIGHDITAVLDNMEDNAYVLNDYYEAELDNYRKGEVNYLFTDIEEGHHTLTLKAWDINNNSSEKSIEFIVSESAQLALEHVLNYPNPFTTHTEFYFEHNIPGDDLNILIQVFTITGRLVKTIETTMNTSGYRSSPIPWDGKDDYGDNIGKGIYLYKVSVRNSIGQKADAIEKLVILK